LITGSSVVQVFSSLEKRAGCLQTDKKIRVSRDDHDSEILEIVVWKLIVLIDSARNQMLFGEFAGRRGTVKDISGKSRLRNSGAVHIRTVASRVRARACILNFR